jgi:phosphoribosylformylglycinamidine synthase subunit PurS
MTQYRVAVHIVPRRGVLDPQGQAVCDALHALGFAAVADVRVGRHIVIAMNADGPEGAELAVRAMCDKLLANPVTEDYEIAGIAPIYAEVRA